MTAPETAALASRTVVEDAARWRLLGLLFERPRAGWLEELRAVASEVDDARLAAAVEAAEETTEGTYQLLFGPGRAVSPREVAYRGRHDPGAVLADLSALYAAFAFHPKAEDPADHVAIEAAFAGYLRLKEAYARARGDVDAAATCTAAFARLRDTHMRYLAQPLAERLAAVPFPTHLALAAQVLFETCGSLPADAVPADSDDGDLGCGGCGSSVGGGMP